MKKNSFRGIIFYVLIFAFFIGALALTYMQQKPEEEKLIYSDILAYFAEGQVESFVLDGAELTMKLTDGKTIAYKVAYTSVFYEDFKEILAEYEEKGVDAFKGYDLIAPKETPWWVSFIPYVILIIAFGFMWFFLMNQANGGGKAMNFSKAKTRTIAPDKKKITFADVAGAEEEKEELWEIVEFLKNPKKFADIGARIPKGVLMVGPPGTGKTYLAKAVAGEAGVPFLSISGSDFVEMFVGVGASRVRDLFDQAKRSSPAIIFIDEIDAVGRQRGAGLGGGHDEREQTLNQLLVEMDGFTQNEGVIVIAATNRPDILDSALLRPGRFDRQIYIGMPDAKAREAILRVHSRSKPLDNSVDYTVVAKTTVGFSPADLENLLNEAALLAARRGKKSIGMPEIDEAVIKVIAGPEKKSRVISEKERRLTAYHEAGHAVVSRFLATQDRVHQISIIPRGRAGGYTLSLPGEDKSYASRSEMFEEIVSLLGGRVAEALTLDDISTGASNDISRSSAIARKMITKYGMSDTLGPITFGSDHDEVFLGRDFATSRNYSEDVAAKIDAEIKAIIDAAYKKCEEILTEHMDAVHAVAKFLLAHEKMEADDFARIFGDELPAHEEAPAPEEAPAAEPIPAAEPAEPENTETDE